MRKKIKEVNIEKVYGGYIVYVGGTGDTLEMEGIPYTDKFVFEVGSEEKIIKIMNKFLNKSKLSK